MRLTLAALAPAVSPSHYLTPRERRFYLGRTGSHSSVFFLNAGLPSASLALSSLLFIASPIRVNGPLISLVRGVSEGAVGAGAAVIASDPPHVGQKFCSGRYIGPTAGTNFSYRANTPSSSDLCDFYSVRGKK